MRMPPPHSCAEGARRATIRCQWRGADGFGNGHRTVRRFTIRAHPCAVPVPAPGAGSEGFHDVDRFEYRLAHRVRTIAGSIRFDRLATDGPALGADHPRPEQGYDQVVSPAVDVDHHPAARHVERPHAVRAHVAEGHWVAGWGSWSCAHAGEDTASAGRKAAGLRRGFRDPPSEAAVCVTIRNGTGSPRSPLPGRSTTQKRMFPIEGVDHRNSNENDCTEGDHCTSR
jgi:hypothetical protein